MDAPFSGLFDSFQLALETERKSANTIYQYWLADTKFAERLRKHDLDDDVTTVTADDVRKWLVSLQGTCAPSTEYRNYSGVRQFFRWCVAEDELDVSPMANIQPPKQLESETPILKVEQMKALLADCKGRTSRAAGPDHHHAAGRHRHAPFGGRRHHRGPARPPRPGRGDYR